MLIAAQDCNCKSAVKVAQSKQKTRFHWGVHVFSPTSNVEHFRGGKWHYNLQIITYKLSNSCPPSPQRETSWQNHTINTQRHCSGFKAPTEGIDMVILEKI